jgi:hypothetical protein
MKVKKIKHHNFGQSQQFNNLHDYVDTCHGENVMSYDLLVGGAILYPLGVNLYFKENAMYY